jgi:DNA-binding NarL/FixJ family response regulator
MKLLIIEDSEHIRASFVSLMECIPSIDCICTAVSLFDAMHCVSKFSPSIDALDLHLPDGFGTELINQIQHLASDVRIAVLTNDASEFNRKICLSLGANWFFDKSTEFEMFLDVVRTMLKFRLSGEFEN